MVLISKDLTGAEAIYNGTYDNPGSLFIPEQDGEMKHWYWPGHGFVSDSILYVFALNMYNDPALVVPSEKDPGQVDDVDKLAENSPLHA